MSTWDWSKFRGSRSALKYAKRDLADLITVINLVPRRRVALQAGGSLGVWPKRLAGSFDRVLTCEPDPLNFEHLLANAPESNISAFPLALGERLGTVGLCRKRRDGRPDSHDGCVHVAGDGTTPVITIDSFALPVCDLIYLDLEGYELFALRGALETLRRCRPVVAAEINKHLSEYGCSEAQIMYLMSAEGYRVGPRYGLDQVWMPTALEAVA